LSLAEKWVFLPRVPLTIIESRNYDWTNNAKIVIKLTLAYTNDTFIKDN